MANAFKAVQAEIYGLQQVEANLKQISEKIDREVNRRALREASKPMLRQARANATGFKSSSGALRRSLGTKVKTSKRRKAVTIYVGPRTGRSKTGPDGRVRDPVRYAHLIELGRKTRAPFAGTHFLEKAFKSTRGEAFQIWKEQIKGKLPGVILSVSRRARKRRGR